MSAFGQAKELASEVVAKFETDGFTIVDQPTITPGRWESVIEVDIGVMKDEQHKVWRGYWNRKDLASNYGRARDVAFATMYADSNFKII